MIENRKSSGAVLQTGRAQRQPRNVRSTASPRVMWIASFPGAVIDGVCFVDCIFRGVRTSEVVEAGGSILFRNVKMNRQRGAKFELAADVAVSRYQ